MCMQSAQLVIVFLTAIFTRFHSYEGCFGLPFNKFSGTGMNSPAASSCSWRLRNAICSRETFRLCAISIQFAHMQLVNWQNRLWPRKWLMMPWLRQRAHSGLLTFFSSFSTCSEDILTLKHTQKRWNKWQKNMHTTKWVKTAMTVLGIHVWNNWKREMFGFLPLELGLAYINQYLHRSTFTRVHSARIYYCPTRSFH